MTSVLITGANGFIARHLAKILKQEGLHTVGISRKASRIYCFDKIYTAYLGESLKSVFEEEAIDVVVHCAHHGGKKEFEANVNGTILWMEEARSHGVELQVFLSSLLAKTDALSGYGRAKFELEKQFVSAHQVVYRPGLVVGDGGMFGKMKRSIQKLPVVPLLDKGTTKVYVTGIEFLCYVMMSVRRQFRYLCWFIPVPSSLVLRFLLVVEKLPFFKLNIGSTNLKGLRQSGQEDPRSDFDMFGYPEEDLDALVKKIGDW